MFCIWICLIFKCEIETCADKDTRDHQFVVGPLELSGILEPSNHTILQLDIVI